MFDRPIGQNQAIQHPLAENWMALEAAGPDGVQGGLALRHGQARGAEANAAKYLAGEAGFEACQQAVMTHGGFGYAKEYHVERYLREVVDPAHRAGQPRADPVLHRREGARPAEILLRLYASGGSHSAHRTGHRLRRFCDDCPARRSRAGWSGRRRAADADETTRRPKGSDRAIRNLLRSASLGHVRD